MNLTDHRSERVTPEGLDWAELILVMDGRQRRRSLSMAVGRPSVELLGDFDPRPIETRAILDPIDAHRDVFQEVYARIDACCSELVPVLTRGGDA